MRRTSAAAALALLLTLGACAAEASGPPAPTGPTAGPTTKDVILRGAVLDDGEPVAGATVWIELMPVDDILAELPEGATFDTWDTDPVRTDEHGRYTLTLDPDELGPDFLDGDVLNTDIYVEKGRTWASWGHPFARLDDGWRSDEHSTVSDGLTEMRFDLGRETITTVLSTGEQEKAELPVGTMP